MKLDEIIPLLGNFGRYQFAMVCYVCIYNIVGCMSTLGNVFYAAETDHWCSILPNENCSSWAEFQDNCTEVKKSIFLPPPEDPDSDYPYSNCQQWVPPEGYVFDPYTSLSEYNNYSYSKVPCTEWEFDRSQYKTTTIWEVSLATLNSLVYFSSHDYTAPM